MYSACIVGEARTFPNHKVNHPSSERSSIFSKLAEQFQLAMSDTMSLTMIDVNLNSWSERNDSITKDVADIFLSGALWGHVEPAAINFTLFPGCIAMLSRRRSMSLT